VSWRKPRQPGLRPGEEVLVEVRCTILDSTGTSLPAAGTPATIGVTDERLMVWSVPRPLVRTGRLLGSVGRTRIRSVVADRREAQTAVLFTFDEGAVLKVEAPAELHPEQLVWLLTADATDREQ
jgi:hypothetical protein